MKKEFKVGQTVKTDDDYEVDILDVLPNTLIVYSNEEGIIILRKNEVTEME